MFDIADVPFSCVESDEKRLYTAKMKETGSYQGYKPRQYWVSREPALFRRLFQIIYSTLVMGSTINWNITIVRVLPFNFYPPE